MTPEYLNELADIADPEKLWRKSGIDQMDFTQEQKRQVSAGVALRRHASHIQQLLDLIGTGKSLLLTPLSPGCTDVRSVPTPDGVAKLQERPNSGIKARPEGASALND